MYPMDTFRYSSTAAFSCPLSFIISPKVENERTVRGCCCELISATLEGERLTGEVIVADAFLSSILYYETTAFIL